jgi:hypothetical protein
VDKVNEMARPDTPASATSEDASVTKVEGQHPRASKRPRKVTETGGRRLGGSKSHSPAVGETGQGGKNRRSKVYQAGKENNIMVMVVVLTILMQEQLQKMSKCWNPSSFTMWGVRMITCPAWTTS